MYKILLYRYIQIILISEIIVMTMSSLQGRPCYPNLQFYSEGNTMVPEAGNDFYKQPEVMYGNQINVSIMF